MALSRIAAAMVAFALDGVATMKRTVQDRLRDTVSVKDFGVKGDGTVEYTGIKAAWDYCLLHGKNLHFPAGVYNSGADNMPFKHTAFPATDVLDCKNITIYGEGPATTLMSDSVAGADVLNLYSVKNLHFRNLRITAKLAAGATGSGSNGTSVVGGFDNLTFSGMQWVDLPYVDKGTYLDGGKAFTVQPGTPATECGTIRVSNSYARGCVHGVGLEVDLVNWATKKHAIDVELTAEDCYYGAVFSAGAASAALSPAMTMGYRLRLHLINCQRNVGLSRAHGVDVAANVVTTKTVVARRTNPRSVVWHSADSVVDALYCVYAKNSRVVITGDIGACDYKFQIGGASAGASGIAGHTESCSFHLDLGGTAATAPLNVVDFGGNTTSRCDLFISSNTMAAVPVALYTPALLNTVTYGTALRAPGMKVSGPIQFAYDDGVATYHEIKRTGTRLDFCANVGSSGDIINFGFQKNTGSMVFGVRNDGALVTTGFNTAASVATVSKVMPVYNEAGVLLGYIPLYNTFA